MRLKQSVVGFIALVALILTPLAPPTWSGSTALAQTSDPPGRVGRLNYMSGQVSFAPGGINEWAPAVLNYPLSTGTALWTDEGARAELHVGSTAIRMDQTTEVDILNLDDQTTQLRVPQGTIDIGQHQLAAGERFEVDTPSAAITLVRRGRYRIAADPAGQSVRVTVWSGQADVATSRYTFAVNAGQTVIISDNSASPYAIVPTAGLDPFGQWSLARWQRERQAFQVATRYVPASMTGFEDLAYYGNWRPAGGYGNAWFPSVQSNWAPYRYGRWVYIAPWGWTWVDDAPWGFAPSHYGRWVLIGSQWAWIPGPATMRPVYAPALVVFVLLLGGGMGWFPLAPQEVYVPPYYYSPTYYRNVNPTVVNITVVNITNITYVYRHLPKAVTVVRQETVLRSDPVARAIITVPQPEIANAKVAASAPLQPTLPSLLGHSGQTTTAPKPPAAVQQRPVIVTVAPPAPVVPPAVVQQAPVRNVPVKPAVEPRGGASPKPVQPIAPTAQPAQPVAPAPVPPQPAVPTPRPAQQPKPTAPQPAVAPTPIPPQPAVPTPRPAQQPKPTAPQPAVAPTPVPPQPGVATPRPRPTPTPNCDPRSKNYDPTRCPTPTPKG